MQAVSAASQADSLVAGVKAAPGRKLAASA